MAKKNRLIWMINLRGLMMVLVVIFHVTQQYSAGWTQKFMTLNSVVLPLFFFLSGMMLKTNMPTGDFLKNKASRILLPYLFFAGLSYGIYLLRKLISPTFMAGSDPLQLFLGIFYGTNISGWFLNVPLWFLPCLFIMQCLTYFSAKFKKPVFIGLLILWAVIGYLLEKFVSFPLPWSMNHAFSDVIFVGAGYLMAKKLCASNYQMSGIATTAAIVTWALTSALAITLTFNSIPYVLLKYVAGMTGVLCLIGIFQRLPKISYLSTVSKNTLEILGLQSIAFMLTTSLLRKIFHIPVNSVIESLVNVVPPLQIYLVIMAYLFAGLIGPIWMTRLYNALRPKAIQLFNQLKNTFKRPIHSTSATTP